MCPTAELFRLRILPREGRIWDWILPGKGGVRYRILPRKRRWRIDRIVGSIWLVRLSGLRIRLYIWLYRMDARLSGIGAWLTRLRAWLTRLRAWLRARLPRLRAWLRLGAGIAARLGIVLRIAAWIRGLGRLRHNARIRCRTPGCFSGFVYVQKRHFSGPLDVEDAIRDGILPRKCPFSLLVIRLRSAIGKHSGGAATKVICKCVKNPTL